jgi:hypothetical protein
LNMFTIQRAGINLWQSHLQLSEISFPRVDENYLHMRSENRGFLKWSGLDDKF